VHCSIGASRAPTAVMAYLVYARGIPLVDAFQYLVVLRPLVIPNQHFLFELAKLEVFLLFGF
jgi:protein-tyrosine phosphatase